MVSAVSRTKRIPVIIKSSYKCEKGEILIPLNLEEEYAKYKMTDIKNNERVTITYGSNQNKLILKVIGVSEYNKLCYMNFEDMSTLGADATLDIAKLLFQL